MTPSTTRFTPWRRWVGGILAATSLLGTFWLYTRPDFLFTLANQAWSCF